MSTELEGAALFNAAAKVIGKFDAMFSLWTVDAQWLIVPAMLEWLRRGNQRSTAITINRYGWAWVSSTHWADPNAAQETDADLPTALARLVLRVHELEQPAKGEGEKQ